MFLQIVRNNGLLLEVWNLFDLLLDDNNIIINNNSSHSTHQRFVNFDDVTLLCEVGNFPRVSKCRKDFSRTFFTT